MEQQNCYIFQPENPSKRRRVEPQGLDTSFELRKNSYRDLWTRQNEIIDDVIREANAETLTQIHDFISSAHDGKSNVSMLPAGFVETGPGSVTNGTLFEQLREDFSETQNHVFATLTVSDCPNLKTLFKILIQRLVQQNNNETTNQARSVANRTPKLLNYDLQILHDWCQTRDVQRVVILFQDVEAFDAALLTDALFLLKPWLGRIPLVLFFTVATSVELFQERLPRRALRTFEGRLFEVSKTDDVLQTAFEICMSSAETQFWLGPGLTQIIFKRQNDHFESIEAFRHSLKYAYMSHFYGNPLSAFLPCEASSSSFKAISGLSGEHYEAIRNVGSFQGHVEKLLLEGQTSRAEQLLSNDEILRDEVCKQLEASTDRMRWSLGAIAIIHTFHKLLTAKQDWLYTTLYVKCLAGELFSSSIVSELLLSIRKTPSDVFLSLLPPIVETIMTMPPCDIVVVSPDDFLDVQDQLKILISSNGSSTPLTSQSEVLRAAMTRNSISGMQKPQASEYTNLVTRFHDLVFSYLSQTLTNYQDLVFHELLIYDLRSPHREVFMPRPRFAIERALSAPHDYLGCECCCGTENGLSPTQPPTAILYQLYLDSGALINGYDLWSAFRAVLSEKFEDEKMCMALFERGLAELKSMGFVKSSRKKTDHIAKLAWKGL